MTGRVPTDREINETGALNDLGWSAERRWMDVWPDKH